MPYGWCVLAMFLRGADTAVTLPIKGVLAYQFSRYQTRNSPLTELLGSCFFGGGS